MKPTLLILAAGMGSRYGGLKQIDPVGPNGELIIDYSIYDALRGGFGKLVFIIRRHFEDAFREKIGNTFDGRVETAYAYQELDSYVDGFAVPPDREKPWGTGHAVLAGESVADEPFAVINADDYYGRDSFTMMADFLSGDQVTPSECALMGYILRNTLSEHGTVARGICQCDDASYLQTVVERTKVEGTETGARFLDDDGTAFPLTGDEPVSMNFWGFHPSMFGNLREAFQAFLQLKGNEPKSEFYIPTVVDELVNGGRMRARVLPTRERWFGVTYREDKAFAERSIRALIADGVYPEKLWER